MDRRWFFFITINSSLYVCKYGYVIISILIKDNLHSLISFTHHYYSVYRGECIFFISIDDDYQLNIKLIVQVSALVDTELVAELTCTTVQLTWIISWPLDLLVKYYRTMILEWAMLPLSSLLTPATAEAATYTTTLVIRVISDYINKKKNT